VLSAGTKQKEREKIYAQFRAGDVKLLLSCEVLLEGYDEPSAEGVLFARPTQSQSFMIQAAGRAMRLYPGKTEAIIIDCVGNTERHQLVQLATLAGFEPELPLNADPNAEPTEETDDNDPTVLGADIRGEEFSFHARQARTRYMWRETGVGWILQVPKIGYYLVAWNDRGRTRATIRFYDQRKGRRDTIPREVCAQPIAFEIAYSMVESEMDRIFNARANRRREAPEEVEDAPDISFVDFDDGLEEPTEIPEDWVLRGAEWRDMPITERQRSLLTKLSAKRTTLPTTAGEASDLIVILQVEYDSKWREPATEKQIAYIRVNGLDWKPEMTKKAAARQIWQHRKRVER
jgi:superfamily II DNA/RNA helicase